MDDQRSKSSMFNTPPVPHCYCRWLWMMAAETENNKQFYAFHASHWRERARVNGPFESELRAISMRIILLRSLTMKMQKRRRRRRGKKKQQNIGNSTHIIIDINQGMHFRFGREMCRAWTEHPLALFSILCRKCKHQTNLMHTHEHFTTHLFRFGATFSCLDKFGASVCVCMFFSFMKYSGISKSLHRQAERCIWTEHLPPDIPMVDDHNR